MIEQSFKLLFVFLTISSFRCVLDLVMAQKDGKYLIVKDPNKGVLRLYDIPDNTFESDEESEESEEGMYNYFVLIFLGF